MTPDLTDPDDFRRALLRLIQAQPSRASYWSILLADSEAGEAPLVTDIEQVAREMDEMRAERTATHNALCFVNGADGQEVKMAFGYFQGEPTAAVFRGSDKAPIMIPREVLQIAIEQGWEE